MISKRPPCKMQGSRRISPAEPLRRHCPRVNSCDPSVGNTAVVFAACELPRMHHPISSTNGSSGYVAEDSRNSLNATSITLFETTDAVMIDLPPWVTNLSCWYTFFFGHIPLTSAWRTSSGRVRPAAWVTILAATSCIPLKMRRSAISLRFATCMLSSCWCRKFSNTPTAEEGLIFTYPRSSSFNGSFMLRRCLWSSRRKETTSSPFHLPLSESVLLAS